MQKFTPALALFASLLAVACGPMAPTGDASSTPDGTSPSQDGTGNTDCTNPCSCADRGPPDFSHENEGAQPPVGDQRQHDALVRANHWRTAAGLAPLNGNAQIQQAATAHASYLATDDQQTCWPNPHQESSSCAGYTGTNMGDRMTSAGYEWTRASEVINWEDSANAAVDGWIWTVYHRQSFMDYRMLDTGYAYHDGTFGGRPATHNVMDFGAPRSGDAHAPNGPVVFPVPGLTGVPAAFRGDLEGPTPPAPGGGTGAWPRGVSSGTVVSMHFPGDAWTVTEHHLFSTANGACTEVEHTYISKDNDPNLNRGTPSNDVFLYANEPLAAATEYVASISGTWNGQAFTRTWAFTTE
jgi:uncharacterized protein YkwD